MATAKKKPAAKKAAPAKKAGSVSVWMNGMRNSSLSRIEVTSW